MWPPVTMVYTDSGGKYFVDSYTLFAHNYIFFSSPTNVEDSLTSLWKMLDSQETTEGRENEREKRRKKIFPAKYIVFYNWAVTNLLYLHL